MNTHIHHSCLHFRSLLPSNAAALPAEEAGLEAGTMSIIIGRQRQDMVALAPAPAIPDPGYRAPQTAASHAVCPVRDNPPVERFANASPASRLQDPAALALEAERRMFAATVEYLLAFLDPSIRQQAEEGLATMLLPWVGLETERIQLESGGRVEQAVSDSWAFPRTSSTLHLLVKALGAIRKS